ARASVISFFLPCRPPSSTLFPYTTLFRSRRAVDADAGEGELVGPVGGNATVRLQREVAPGMVFRVVDQHQVGVALRCARQPRQRSEEHTSELQSRENLVCRLLLEKKKTTQ